MKKFSIIIPVYNGGRYLKSCLDSIYNKTKNVLEQFEVIIINDGSTDNSNEIYKKYKKKYNNIIIIENSNHGVSYSRNCGIDKAKGKYIMFVDCDDYLEKNWYETINKKYDYADADVICFSRNFINKYDFTMPKQEIASYIITYNKYNIRIPGPVSKLYKNSFIKDNGIVYERDLINGEDMIFNLKSLSKASRFLLIKDSFYVVRHNQFSCTNKFDERIIASEVLLNKKVGEIFNGTEISKVYNIQKYAFLTSVRTLAYRGAMLKKYCLAKKLYKKIRNDVFFDINFKNYTIKNSLKSSILYYCFKYKFYAAIYYICKKKNMNNQEEWFELL